MANMTAQVQRGTLCATVVHVGLGLVVEVAGCLHLDEQSASRQCMTISKLQTIILEYLRLYLRYVHVVELLIYSLLFNAHA